MKTRVLALGLCSALCVPLAACEGGAGGPVANKDEIAKSLDDQSRQLLEDFRSKDSAKISAHYAEDATFAIPNVAVMTGRDAITTGVEALVSDPAFALDIASQKTEVGAAGDIAYKRGSYTVSFTNPTTKQPSNESGTFLLVYKRQADGNWKIVEDVSTPGVPADAAAPPPADTKTG